MIQNKSRINLDPKMAWPVSVEDRRPSSWRSLEEMG